MDAQTQDVEIYRLSPGRGHVRCRTSYSQYWARHDVNPVVHAECICRQGCRRSSTRRPLQHEPSSCRLERSFSRQIELVPAGSAPTNACR